MKQPHGLPHTCVINQGEPYPVVVNKKSMVPCKTTRGLFKHEGNPYMRGNNSVGQ